MTTTTEAPTDPGLYPNVPEEVYHSDTASLSSTAVRLLVKQGGPAKLQGAEREHNDDFDLGTAAHTLLLGTGADIEVFDAASWQIKHAKEGRIAARAGGKVPLLRKQYDTTRRMVDAALSRPEVAALFPPAPEGVAEMSGYAIDPETWVMLRARFDYLVFGPDKRVKVRDYKTTKNAAPREFSKSAVDYGYHVQAAHYIRVLKALGYEVDDFVLLAQEKTAPYLTSLHEFDAEALAAGDRVVTAGIGIYAQCCDTGIWPDYGTETNRMSLPSWALGEW
ncbi:PD-(D/E)XK nuclease-like domain-containing protein [Nocardia sp. NPDC057227]|uniref:PD-(D/E)XK nuclease-like domain-containing protein n=1 Tax=Nocardia sp. NPDC057227 TaxID=3346056 RepID=UPI00362FE1F6